MAKEILFIIDGEEISSERNLNLILQKAEVPPAQPKLNFVDIPGADGSKDLTEALGVGVKYYDRELKFTFALKPSDYTEAAWLYRQEITSGLLNGKRAKIVLWWDDLRYFDGRLSVSEHIVDGMIKQIVVTAICKPYKYEQAEDEETKNLTTTESSLWLNGSVMPVVPTLTVTTATTVRVGSKTFSLSAGSHKFPDIVLTASGLRIYAKTVSGTGTLTATYRRGSF